MKPFHHMTFDERFAEALAAHERSRRGCYAQPQPPTRAFIDVIHMTEISIAILESEPVPMNVIAEYEQHAQIKEAGKL